MKAYEEKTELRFANEAERQLWIDTYGKEYPNPAYKGLAADEAVMLFRARNKPFVVLEFEKNRNAFHAKCMSRNAPEPAKPVPKPESMSDLTEDELTAVERTGDLPLGTLSRLISEVRSLRKERKRGLNVPFGEVMSSVTCNRTITSEGIPEVLEPGATYRFNGTWWEKVKITFTEKACSRPHVHEWSRTMLQPPFDFDNVSKFGCSCGATKVEEITEPE